jgi:uncharacterized protein (DUF362 family)
MKSLSRRQFLLSLAAGASAMAISACEQKKPTSQKLTNTEKSSTESLLPTANPSSNSTPVSTATRLQQTKETAIPSTSPITNQKETDTPVPIPTDTQAAAVIAPSGNPDLVVARGGDDPETIVRRAIAALGGMEQFVFSGAKVVIKPNICTAYHSYEYASTTNPWVVGALVKMCLEAGAGDVSVMDFPFGGTADQAYTISGIQEQVEAAGGKMVLMSSLKFAETPIPNGKKIKKWPVYEDVLTADVFINVPIAKNHGLSVLTLGMKNLMGVVQNREGLHANIGQRLADLTSLMYPTLTVIDSIRILLSGGPTGGDLNAVKKLDTIIAGRDIVAADSYATTLFGYQPDDISYIKAAASMGLGRSDLQSLKIEEITVGG